MNLHRVAAWASTVVVASAVVVGLVVSGLPGERRLERLDEARVADLRTLASAIESYWHAHAEMPEHLGTVLDGRRLLEMPADPVTGQWYEYELTPPDGYRLCATFDRPSPPTVRPGEEAFWKHGAGGACYEFELGPSRAANLL